MRSKTFRRKHGKMSRRRRAGQVPAGSLARQTTAEMSAMEEGRLSQPAKNPFNLVGRSNTADLVAMEEGNANPQVAIDIEQTPDIEMGMPGSGGRKRRTRKSRKGGKRRKSHRR